MISLGLDLSLRETGCVILDNGKILDKWLIKSKPNGKRPIDELMRLIKISDEIRLRVNPKVELKDIKVRPHGIIYTINPVDIVVIEGLAYMARNTTSLVQLSGLNYMVRSLLYEYNIKFIIVAPTTLKKFITGKGNAQKDEIMMNVYKRYHITLTNNNLADAYVLARIGEALLNKKIKLTKPQKETIELLKKQLNNH